MVERSSQSSVNGKVWQKNGENDQTITIDWGRIRGRIKSYCGTQQELNNLLCHVLLPTYPEWGCIKHVKCRLVKWLLMIISIVLIL